MEEGSGPTGLRIDPTAQLYESLGASPSPPAAQPPNFFRSSARNGDAHRSRGTPRPAGSAGNRATGAHRPAPGKQHKPPTHRETGGGRGRIGGAMTAPTKPSSPTRPDTRSDAAAD